MTEKTTLALPMEDEIFFHELTKLLPRLRRLALGITGSPTRGNQVVQSACRQALGRYSHMTPGTLIDRWLFGLVTEEWLSAAAPSTPYQIPNTPDQAETQMAESRTTVSRFLSGLETRDRIALIMVCVEGARHAEVGQRLSMTESDVRAMLALRRRELADILNPCHQKDAQLLDDAAMIAYIDDELSPEEAHDVSGMIRSAGAALTTLRHATTALRAAINEPMHEPVPELLLSLIDDQRAELSHRAAQAEQQFMRAAKLRTVGLWALGLCLSVAAASAIYIAAA